MSAGTIRVFMAALLAGAIPVGAYGVAPPVGPRDVVRFSINAAGGAKALARIMGQGYCKSKKVETSKTMTRTIHGEQWYSGGKQFALEKVVEWEGSLFDWQRKSFTRRAGFDGMKYWESPKTESEKSVTGTLAMGILKGVLLPQVLHASRAKGLLVLQERPEKHNVSILREERIRLGEAITLKVGAEGMPDVLLSFDRNSWLLVKADVTYQLLPFVTMRRETTYSEFKKIEGCLIPTRWLTLDGETKVETTIMERKHLAEIDERIFRKPAARR